MKILNSISSAYEDVYPLAVRLQHEVEKIVQSFKIDSWHYYGRIKTKESFAQKVETGRVQDIREMDDFFACTIVVKNKSEIKEAEKRIHSHFYVRKRKPKDDVFTQKEPFSFEFDGLRLYVNIKPAEYLPPSAIDKFVFEIQIKTFLEHAWSITTHDLIYKSDDISWPKARLAYQLKAMLELAETSLNNVDKLAESPELAKHDRENLVLSEVRHFLVSTFPPESLPTDLLRLTRNVLNLFGFFSLKIDEIRTLLERETEAGRGVKTLDLSPYCIILQTIIFQAPEHFTAAFHSAGGSKAKGIFVPREIDISGFEIKYTERIIRS